MTSWTKELDEAACLATRSGHWHTVLFYLLCGLAAIPTSFLVFSQVFTNATPAHWCAPPPELQLLQLPPSLLQQLTAPGAAAAAAAGGGGGGSCLAYDVDPRALHVALAEYLDERSEIVREDGAIRMVRIQKLVPATGAKEREEQLKRVSEAVLSVRSSTPTPCKNGWLFSREQYNRTLVTEFQLVCDKEWWPRASNTLFWVGSIFGNLFFGWMSDRYGRRITILLMVFLEVPLSIATSFPSSYMSYTVLRMLCGLFFPALYQQPFILALELMPPSKRTYTGIVVSSLFASGMSLLSLLAYLMMDWYRFSLATSLPFIVLYSYYWLIPESPRWLVGRGRIADAENVLRKIAKKNNIELQRGFLLDIHKRLKEDEDAKLEAVVLSNVNGRIHQQSVSPSEDEDRNPSDFDRNLTNMLTFKPDLNKISEIDDNQEIEKKTGDIERILALEVAEIAKKKSRLKDEEKDNEKDEDSTEESHLNLECNQKATQTDSFIKPLDNTLRRMSIQFVTKILHKDVECDKDFENRLRDERDSIDDSKASPLDIFKYPNIRKNFFILTFDWVALGVVYNSLSYNTPNLGVNDYVAFFIGGVVELPSYFLTWKCMDHFGRRWVLCTLMCTGGLACLSCIFVPEAFPWVTVALAMFGRFCTAGAFAVFYVQIGELLPTVLRAQAMGYSSFISGLGLLACPYIVYLAVYSKVLPLTIMGILTVAGGVTSLFLPETLNQPLPQTVADGEVFGRNHRVLSCVTRHDNG